MKLIHAKLDSLKQSTDRIEGKLDTLTEIMHQLLEQIPEPGSGKATGEGDGVETDSLSESEKLLLERMFRLPPEDPKE
ncbi:MAG: hypothetical protein WDW38_004764 [Sanguina aurantia]